MGWDGDWKLTFYGCFGSGVGAGGWDGSCACEGGDEHDAAGVLLAEVGSYGLGEADDTEDEGVELFEE